jgi:D-arabinose 1-dehydrogenase-like Zn-dependent alcohol dehydrogenase
MHRARLDAIGFDRPLRYESASPPTPTGHDVLVEVEACGVCHRDLLDRGGRFPFQQVPITPGHEAAGRVIAVGADVRHLTIGDRVATMHRDACGECRPCLAGDTSLCQSAAFVLGILVDGGYATNLLAPESAFYRTDEGLSGPEAAVLHCTFGTAYRDLVTLGGMRAGDRVLVTGANGGVGAAALQIASRLGAEVTAVIRDGKHEDFVRAQGATNVTIDPGDGFHRHVRGIDVALDTVGVSTFNSALRALRVGGRMVVVGNIVNEKASLNLGYVITNGLTVVGGSGATPREMTELLRLHRERPFAIAIDRVLPLSRAEEAQGLVRAGGLRGRVALVPDTKY